MPVTYSVRCSESVTVDWSAVELGGSFLCLPVNWTAEPFVCFSALHPAGWCAWRSLNSTAFVPEGCSVSCCVWRSAWNAQLGAWVGPTAAACGWDSGPGSGPAGRVQWKSAAGVNLGEREDGNNSQLSGVVDYNIGTTKERAIMLHISNTLFTVL